MSYTYRYPHPAVTTDVVIFTIRQDRLQILLIKRTLPPHKNQWALPGGFVELEESLEEGARRELEEETGVKNVFLELDEAARQSPLASVRRQRLLIRSTLSSS